MKQLNRTDLKRLMGQAYGDWYWHRRWNDTQSHRVALILAYRGYRRQLKDAPPETNELGNIIWRGGDADERLRLRKGDARYLYDTELCGAGWKQFDTKQDAWYFGVWVNIEKRMVFTYAEGDRTLTECPTIESFKAQLDSMEKFYGPPPPAMIAYGQEPDGSWVRTEIYDTRPQVA